MQICYQNSAGDPLRTLSKSCPPTVHPLYVPHVPKRKARSFARPLQAYANAPSLCLLSSLAANPGSLFSTKIVLLVFPLLCYSCVHANILNYLSVCWILFSQVDLLSFRSVKLLIVFGSFSILIQIYIHYIPVSFLQASFLIPIWV